MKNYYEILGLNENASQAQIKTAYRKLSQKFHPDKNQGDPYFTEMFKNVNEAYEHLKENKNQDSNKNNFESESERPKSESYTEKSRTTEHKKPKEGILISTTLISFILLLAVFVLAFYFAEASYPQSVKTTGTIVAILSFLLLIRLVFIVIKKRM